MFGLTNITKKSNIVKVSKFERLVRTVVFFLIVCAQIPGNVSPEEAALVAALRFQPSRNIFQLLFAEAASGQNTVEARPARGFFKSLGMNMFYDWF